GLERDGERLERLRGDTLTLVDQPEQDVLGTDVAVVQQARFLLCEDHDPASPIGEAFEHVSPSIRVANTWTQCTGGLTRSQVERSEALAASGRRSDHVRAYRVGMPAASGPPGRRPLRRDQPRSWTALDTPTGFERCVRATLRELYGYVALLAGRDRAAAERLV